MTGKANGHKWQPWRPRVTVSQKVEILHEQVDILQERIDRLNAQVDQNEVSLRAEIRQTADGIASQMRQL